MTIIDPGAEQMISMHAAPDRSALVGRHAELAATSDRIREVLAGAADNVVIAGEAGIGKSRMLDAAPDDAATAGIRVLRGTADDPASPLGPLRQALGCHRVGADGSMDAVVRRVEQLAGGGAVVLAIEDLQWADVATLEALRWMCTRPLPLALVATVRPVPRHRRLDRCVDGLVASGGLLLTLDGLPDDDVRVLAQAALGATPGPRLTAELSRACGNPLYVTELLADLSRSSRLTLANGHAELTDVRHPAELDDFVAR